MPRRQLEFCKEAFVEKKTGEIKTQWRIRDWKPIYTKILVCIQKGMTPMQIAQEAEIGYSKDQINALRKDPLFRLKLAQYTKKMDIAIIDRATEEMITYPEVELAKNKLLEAAEKAADALIALVDVTPTAIKNMTLHERRLLASLAQDILNRTGLKEIKTEDSNKQGREYSPDEIRSALDNAKELEAIAARLDGRTSSYVLSKEERRDISPAELTAPDFNNNSFSEETTDSEQSLTPSNIAPQETKENNRVDESPI